MKRKSLLLLNELTHLQKWNLNVKEPRSPSWGVSLNSVAPTEYRNTTRRVKERCWIPIHQSTLIPPENRITEEWPNLFHKFHINDSALSTVTYFPSTSTPHWNVCHDRRAIRRKIRDTQHLKLAESFFALRESSLVTLSARRSIYVCCK